jgi:tripartite ATP-independent transporter DctM subunit
MPIGFIMAAIGFVGFGTIVNFDAALNLLAKDFYSTFSSYSLTVIPLFVLMGQLAFHTGLSTRLFDAAYKFIGHLPGGLAIAAVGACSLFSAICGSTNATAATMAATTLPEMKRYNYRPELATGVVASGGSLGILIPPSVIFILYGIMTEQSIGKLFAAGFIPGIMEAVFYIITISIICKINPKLGPRGPKLPLKTKVAGLWGGTAETMAIFILVLGGLFGGWFTPTEAGGVGAALVLGLSVALRRLNWEGFIDSVSSTTRTAAMILILVLGAVIFNKFIAVTRLPFALAEWVVGLDMPPMAVMGLIIFVYLIGGCFMDALGLILLTVPIFFPVAIELGFNPIWFGIIITRVTEIGVITPPVGMNVYVIKGVARDVPLSTIFRGVIPFLMADVISVLLLLFVPQITLWLPSLISY